MGNSSITHVIIRSSGTRRQNLIVQARALKFNAAHDALYMDISVQKFKNKAQFDWSGDDKYAWQSTSRNALLVDGDSHNFQQESYSNKSASANSTVNTRQNVEDGTAAAYTPLVQGTSYRDVAKTQQIYNAMRANTNLSANAENVEVGTLNGLTTLRGHVNTEAEKRAIGDIAAKAGQGLAENLSNLLEVRPRPVAH